MFLLGTITEPNPFVLPAFTCAKYSLAAAVATGVSFFSCLMVTLPDQSLVSLVKIESDNSDCFNALSISAL